MTTLNFIFVLAIFTLVCAGAIGIWQLMRTREAKRTGEPAEHQPRDESQSRHR